jgi:hypothetical protein
VKGVVFTAFLEMVESQFTANMVDDIIDDCHLPSGGAYTAVGTYPHEEMVDLVVALSKRSGISIPDLLRAYGQHLFTHFFSTHPAFFVNVHDALNFLAGIEVIIHAEVLKLYPDAQLPRFETEHRSQDQLVLLYDSSRHFEDLAEGLITGCIAHFGEKIEVRREAIDHLGQRRERFILTRQ